MDGSHPDTLYTQERRRRLAAERMLEHTRRDLGRAHSALVSQADRLSRDYLSTREHNLRLSERQERVLAQRKVAAEKADRARRRLWHALEAMRDGFALFDADGILIAANHVYLDLFDCAGTIGPGASAAEIFELAAEEGAFDTGPLEPGEWADAQVARWTEEPIPPITLRHFEGRTIRLQDRRAPDGDIVSLAIDVSEEEGRLAALSEARDSAETVARAKADFLARMSHEIRTPMNGVIGLSDMLVEQVADEEARLCARTIRDSAQALLVIVNDTLDVSRLEAGKMDLRTDRFDLEAMLRDCIRLAAASGPEAVPVAFGWPLDAPRHVQGDEGRVRQIVMNLLGNALKFTREGAVTLRATVASEGVAIAVADTGPGIPPDRQDRVFEAFGQVEGPGAQEGTGLGLTISRGLAERMGGGLTLESRVGAGTTFTLTLPLGVGAAATLPALPMRVGVGPGAVCDALAGGLSAAGVEVMRGPMPDAPFLALPGDMPSDVAKPILLGAARDIAPDLAARATAILPLPVAVGDLLAALAPADDGLAPLATHLPKILLADDNATNRFLLDRMLRGEDVAVTIVSDGAEAVASVRADPPDAVILDISMPVLDGFGAIAEIAAMTDLGGAAPIPCIALTAHTGEEMAARLIEAGFVAHLTKPLKKQDLLDAIAVATGSRAEPRNAP